MSRWNWAGRDRTHASIRGTKTPLWGQMIALLILVAGGAALGAAILWAKSRPAPDLAADVEGRLRSSGLEGDRGSCPSAPQTGSRRPEALAAGGPRGGSPGPDQSAIAIYSRLILEDMDAEDLYLLGRALEPNRKGRTRLQDLREGPAREPRSSGDARSAGPALPAE